MEQLKFQYLSERVADCSLDREFNNVVISSIRLTAAVQLTVERLANSCVAPRGDSVKLDQFRPTWNALVSMKTT